MYKIALLTKKKNEKRSAISLQQVWKTLIRSATFCNFSKLKTSAIFQN